MNMREAVQAALSLAVREKGLCFFTNGFISRIAYSISDRDENFYIIGSMGLVSSVALGAALNSRRKVFVFDGDGSILMNMGVMPVVGALSADNFFHFVFDNSCYGSTGNQPTVSSRVDFVKLARGAGYRRIYSVSVPAKLKTLTRLLANRGPVLLHIKVEKYADKCAPRMPIEPQDLTLRIRRLTGARKSK